MSATTRRRVCFPRHLETRTSFESTRPPANMASAAADGTPLTIPTKFSSGEPLPHSGGPMEVRRNLQAFRAKDKLWARLSFELPPSSEYNLARVCAEVLEPLYQMPASPFDKIKFEPARGDLFYVVLEIWRKFSCGLVGERNSRLHVSLYSLGRSLPPLPPSPPLPPPLIARCILTTKLPLTSST